ncbi:MAG: hypothetical protein KA142_10705, partial [Chromatiaceae bacterium]|nr:hypothetical protein [Chromatiaceae bacterium]
SYSETEHRETVAAVAQVSEHLEADLHSEVQALREDIRELKALLSQGGLAQTPAPRPSGS